MFSIMFITMQMCIINTKHDLDKTMIIVVDNLSRDYDSIIFMFSLLTWVTVTLVNNLTKLSLFASTAQYRLIFVSRLLLTDC